MKQNKILYSTPKQKLPELQRWQGDALSYNELSQSKKKRDIHEPDKQYNGWTTKKMYLQIYMDHTTTKHIQM